MSGRGTRSRRARRSRVVEETPPRHGVRSRGRRRRRRGARRRLLVGLAACVILAAGGAGLWLAQSALDSRAAQRYEAALSLFDAGKYEEAVVALDRVLDRDRSDLPSLVLIGRAYLRLGYAAKAETSLRQALGLGAHPSLVTVPLAKAYLGQGKYEAIFDELPATMRDTGVRAELLLVHGRARLELRQFERAQRDFEQAASLLADHPGPAVGLAVVALRRGRLDDAERHAAQAEAVAPQDAQVWFVKAEIGRARRTPEEAVAAYGEALARDPGHIEARLGRAATLVALDRDQEAMRDLKAVWASRPDDPQANYQYALILAKLDQMDEARKVIERAALGLMGYRTDYVMRHPPSLLLMGMLHFRNGDYERAFPLLDRYVQLEPRNAGARKLLGTILLMRDLPGAALAALAPAQREDGEDPELLILLAQAHTQAGRHGEAASLLRRAVAVEPGSPALRGQLALSRLAAARGGDEDGPLDAALDLGTTARGAGLLIEVLRSRGGDLADSLETARVLSRDQPDSAEAANLHGAVALAAGALDEAEPALRRALALAPGFRPARRNLARLDARRGDFEAARQRLEALVEEDRDDTRAMLALADIALRRERPGAAIGWLERVHAQDPDAVGAALQLVDLYLQAKRLDAARERVAALAGRHPDSVAVRIAQGRVELAAGRQERASALFREATQQETGSERLFRLVRYQLAGGDVDGARASVEKILDADPGYLPAWEVAVELDLRDGRADAALATATRLRELRPDAALGDRLYGDAVAFSGRHADAVRAYRAGLAKADDPALAVRLYRARVAQGDVREAVAELEQWLSQRAPAVDALRALADGYLRLDRVAPALDAYQTLARELPEDAGVLGALARLHLRLGRADALALAERAHALDGRNADTLDALGWVLVHEGRAEQGLRYLRDAQNRAAREPRIRYHVAAALARLGREDEARRELRRLLDGEPHFEGVEDARSLLAELES